MPSTHGGRSARASLVDHDHPNLAASGVCGRGTHHEQHQTKSDERYTGGTWGRWLIFRPPGSEVPKEDADPGLINGKARPRSEWAGYDEHCETGPKQVRRPGQR